MRSLLVAILFVASPAFAKELAPSGEIKLAATGRVHYLGYCASARYLAAAIEGGTPALYQLDLAKRSATNLGARRARVRVQLRLQRSRARRDVGTRCHAEE